MGRERLQSLSLPWKPWVKKCEALKSLQDTGYYCFNIACKDINCYWSRSGQGPFQASPWSQFPYAGSSSGEVWVTMWGHGKQGSKARLEAKFVLPGLGCSLSWPQGNRFARAATLSKPRSSSPGPGVPCYNWAEVHKWPGMLLMTRRRSGASLSTTVEQAAGKSQYSSGECSAVLPPKKSHKPKSK